MPTYTSEVRTTDNAIPIITQPEKLKGTHFTVADATARDALNTASLRSGTLVHLASNDTWWKWSGTAWAQTSVGSTPGSTFVVADLSALDALRSNPSALVNGQRIWVATENPEIYYRWNSTLQVFKREDILHNNKKFWNAVTDGTGKTFMEIPGLTPLRNGYLYGYQFGQDLAPYQDSFLEPVVFDIEAGPSDTTQVYTNPDVIKTMKRARPPYAFWGYPFQWSHLHNPDWGISGQGIYDQEQYRLAIQSDGVTEYMWALFPYFYPLFAADDTVDEYPDMYGQNGLDAGETCMKNIIAEAKEAGKGRPVYLYLWPKFFEVGPHPGNGFISMDLWRLMLETATTYGDGFVVWDNGIPDLPLDWYTELQDFLADY